LGAPTGQYSESLRRKARSANFDRFQHGTERLYELDATDLAPD
jgi:hypothetical protein